jgi:hypothetical protein
MFVAPLPSSKREVVSFLQFSINDVVTKRIIIAFLSWAKLPYEKPFRNFQQVRLFWKFESRRETVGNTRHV